MNILSMKILILLSLFLYWNNLFSQDHNSENVININGVLKNIPDSISNIYYTYINEDTSKNDFQKVPVINNRYHYKVNANGLCFLTMLIKSPESEGAYKDDRNLAILLLNGKNVTITSIDSFSNIQVTGSSAYNEYKKLEKIREPYSLKLIYCFSKLSEQKKKKNSSTIKINEWENKIDSIKENVCQDYIKYVKSNPSSPVAAYALRRCFDFNYQNYLPTIKNLFIKLTHANQNSYYGKQISWELNKKMIVGKKAIGFTLPDTIGNMISLDSFKGNYVFIDFWASWCIPCREENPFIKKAYNKYNSKGFKVLSITLDSFDDKVKWINAIHLDGVPWTQVADFDGKVSKLYEVGGIPQNFLIDPNGVIIAKNLRGGRLEKALSKIFD